MQSVHEFCESLMSFIYSHPESLCIVSLSDAKRELPQWMEYMAVSSFRRTWIMLWTS